MHWLVQDRRRAASFTSASRPSIRRHMNTASHDFVTVDMRGLKAALVARAHAERASVSVLVRRAVAPELLRQANVERARPYRQMLDSLAGDERRHLELA